MQIKSTLQMLFKKCLPIVIRHYATVGTSRSSRIYRIAMLSIDFQYFFQDIATKFTLSSFQYSFRPIVPMATMYAIETIGQNEYCSSIELNLSKLDSNR